AGINVILANAFVDPLPDMSGSIRTGTVIGRLREVREVPPAANRKRFEESGRWSEKTSDVRHSVAHARLHSPPSARSTYTVRARDLVLHAVRFGYMRSTYANVRGTSERRICCHVARDCPLCNAQRCAYPAAHARHYAAITATHGRVEGNCCRQWQRG